MDGREIQCALVGVAVLVVLSIIAYVAGLFLTGAVSC